MLRPLTRWAPQSAEICEDDAPQLLGVTLEEHGVELAAEPVDVEVLQTGLRQLMEHGLEVAETRDHGELEAHRLEGVDGQEIG